MESSKELLHVIASVSERGRYSWTETDLLAWLEIFTFGVDASVIVDVLLKRIRIRWTCMVREYTHVLPLCSNLYELEKGMREGRTYAVLSLLWRDEVYQDSRRAEVRYLYSHLCLAVTSMGSHQQ